MELSTTKILVLLARTGKSKKDLATLSGLSQQTITTILKNGRCKPESAGKIAKAFSVDVTEIIDSEEI